MPPAKASLRRVRVIVWLAPPQPPGALRTAGPLAAPLPRVATELPTAQLPTVELQRVEPPWHHGLPPTAALRDAIPGELEPATRTGRSPHLQAAPRGRPVRCRPKPRLPRRKPMLSNAYLEWVPSPQQLRQPRRTMLGLPSQRPSRLHQANQRYSLLQAAAPLPSKAHSRNGS